jgi:hypothetical protein
MGMDRGVFCHKMAMDRGVYVAIIKHIDRGIYMAIIMGMDVTFAIMGI